LDISPPEERVDRRVATPGHRRSWSARHTTGEPRTGQITIVAGGRDIWDGADSFHFVQRPVTGDFEITARIESFVGSDDWAKAGLMVRRDLSPDSPNLLLGMTSTRGLVTQIRPEPGAHTTCPLMMSELLSPHWIRITRKASSCVFEESFDGLTWRVLATHTLAYPETVYVGLAATSHKETLQAI
jgi:hypothetical protein